MAKFIIVMGPPASGKSTFVELIKNESELNVPVISKDDFKHIMFETIGVEGLELSSRQGAAAWDMLFYLIERLSKSSGVYVLEANFKAHHRARFEALEASGVCTFDQILFTTSVEVLSRRFTDRAKHNRHPGHADSARDTSIKAMQKLLDSEGIFASVAGRRVHIDTSHTATLDYADAYDLIRNNS